MQKEIFFNITMHFMFVFCFKKKAYKTKSSFILHEDNNRQSAFVTFGTTCICTIKCEKEIENLFDKYKLTTFQKNFFIFSATTCQHSISEMEFEKTLSIILSEIVFFR